jgi:hypothetical protein
MVIEIHSDYSLVPFFEPREVPYVLWLPDEPLETQDGDRKPTLHVRSPDQGNIYLDVKIRNITQFERATDLSICWVGQKIIASSLILRRTFSVDPDNGKTSVKSESEGFSGLKAHRSENLGDGFFGIGVGHSVTFFAVSTETISADNSELLDTQRRNREEL